LLSWTLYSLDKNPEVLKKVQSEIDLMVEQNQGNKVVWEAAKDLVYTHAVLYETLRLFPSVPKDVKMCVKDDVWPVR
jgi:cytochrome P450